MRLDYAVINERAVPTDWGLGKAKTGTPFFWIEFKFPEFISSNGNEGVTIRKDMYITNNTLDFVLRDLQVLGWTGKDIAELDKNSSNAHQFTREVLLTTVAESYVPEGKTEPVTVQKVKYINDPNYSPTPKMETEELKDMSKKLKGAIAAYRTKNPVSKTVQEEVDATFDTPAKV